MGIDNLNDYYDVNLKKARLAQLQKFEDFSFIRASLEDRKTIEEVLGRCYNFGYSGKIKTK